MWFMCSALAEKTLDVLDCRYLHDFANKQEFCYEFVKVKYPFSLGTLRNLNKLFLSHGRLAYFVQKAALIQGRSC